MDEILLSGKFPIYEINYIKDKKVETFYKSNELGAEENPGMLSHP